MLELPIIITYVRLQVCLWGRCAIHIVYVWIFMLLVKDDEILWYTIIIPRIPKVNSVAAITKGQLMQHFSLGQRLIWGFFIY